MNREERAAAELAQIRGQRLGLGRTILGVDPGTTATGIAVLSNGKPNRLEVVRASGRTVRDRVISMSAQVRDRVESLGSIHRVDTVAVEWQAIRPTDPAPNDILHLAMIVGAALGGIPNEAKILTPLPVSWKGSISGDIFTQRILDWFKRDLPEVHGAPPSLHHNAYDALGLALWAINERQPWRS